ncbi:MAG: class I SAM-dependent methyltransferase [Clostridiales bacterium]|nr:class I SAM-dependent methyltransferase [Clostridiales bacterium]
MLPPSDALADIGADHGALLISLVLSGKISKGIGVEIAGGPFRNALANVASRGLEDSIEIRLGDGLHAIAPGEVSACVIAGMGGRTIVDILEDNREIAERLTYVLLQPMNREREVRLYLQSRNWRICKEALTEERGILYTILLAERGRMARLNPSEAEFGPLLLAERPPLLARAVRQKIRGLCDIVRQLERSGSEESRIKKKRLEERIREWEDLVR